jgi:hypothetical protein
MNSKSQTKLSRRQRTSFKHIVIQTRFNQTIVPTTRCREQACDDQGGFSVMWGRYSRSPLSYRTRSHFSASRTPPRSYQSPKRPQTHRLCCSHRHIRTDTTTLSRLHDQHLKAWDVAIGIPICSSTVRMYLIYCPLHVPPKLSDASMVELLKDIASGRKCPGLGD